MYFLSMVYIQFKVFNVHKKLGVISSFGYISWPKMAQGTPKKFEKMNKLSSHKKIKKN